MAAGEANGMAETAQDGPHALTRGLISFEGVDGAGKSAQLRRVAHILRDDGVDAVATREPGGSAGAEDIRALLVSGAEGRWSAETELLLFNAARRDHVERTIRPALDRGAVVLCDRFIDSTRAYQAAARGVDPALVELLHARFIGLTPGLTLVFDVDPAIAAGRRAARPETPGDDRYERFGDGFQARLRTAYRAIAAAEPARVRVIDAARSFDEVAEDVIAAVRAQLAAGLQRPA